MVVGSRPVPLAARLLGLLGVALLAVGCICSKENVEGGVIWDPGPESVSGNRFETTPQNGAWLHYPGGRRYKIRHHLGAPGACIDLVPYIAFRAVAAPDGEQADFSVGSGNVVTVEGVDDEFIIIRNNACADFYLRVVATRATDCVDANGAADAADGAAGAAGAANDDDAASGSAGAGNGSTLDSGAAIERSTKALPVGVPTLDVHCR